MFKYNLSHLSRVSRVHLIRKCLFEIVALSIQPILALLLGFARMHMRRLVCFVRVEKESPTENLENCRHTFPTIIQKQDAASGLCAMPSRNIPILHAMRQARRFRSRRTSSASFLPQSSSAHYPRQFVAQPSSELAAWTLSDYVQACWSDESTITAEVFVKNAR